MKAKKVVEVQIVHVGQDAFGQTADHEDIFVPYDRRRAVENAGTSKTSFSVDAIDYPRWLIKKGDVIVALIGEGNEKRRKAVAWAPKCVWDNTGEGELCRKKGQYRFQKPAHQPASVAPKKVRPPQVVDLLKGGVKHLKKIDPSKDKNMVIRVMSGGKQVDKGYGPLYKMLARDSETLLLFANRDNIVEAQMNGEWVQIQNLFIGAIEQIAA